MRSALRLTRSFWTGFFKGLSGPALLMRRLDVKRPPRFSGNTLNSWRRVGRVLEQTMNADGHSNVPLGRIGFPKTGVVPPEGWA